MERQSNFHYSELDSSSDICENFVEIQQAKEEQLIGTFWYGK